jgi:hypothetical protein
VGVKLQTFECPGLIESMAELIEEYMETHPDVTPDEVAATVSYVHGCIFRLAKDAPPANKLN